MMKTFIPDAVVCIKKLSDQKKALFFVELDLGSENLMSQKAYSFLDKLLLYKKYRQKNGLERYRVYYDYDFKGFRVLVVTTNMRRINKLRKELSQRGIRQYIWFTLFDDFDDDIFYKKIWWKSDIKDNSKYAIVSDKTQ